MVSSIAADTSLSGCQTFSVGEGSQLNYTGVLHNQITTNGGINKNGLGTLVLSGANSFTGQINITAGTLLAKSSTALGVGGHNGGTMSFIQDGATLALEGGISLDEHFHVWGAGVGGQGAIRSISGNNALTNAPGGGAGYCLRSNTTVSVEADRLSVSGFYHDSGSYGITKIGSGTLVLTSPSTYTGSTTVSEGVLSLAVSNALQTSSAVNIATGAKIDLNFAGTAEVASLSLNNADQGTGTFSAITHPDYFTGTGSLVVLSTNDGIWSASSNGNWGNSANWTSNSVASGEDRTATFNGATGTTVSLEANRTIGNLHFSVENYTIDGSGVLTLTTTSGMPAITVAGGRTATLSASATSANGVQKLGTGNLVLNGSASKSLGGLNISQGTVHLDVAANLGGVTIQSGATLLANGAWNFAIRGSSPSKTAASSRHLTLPTASAAAWS